VSENQLGIFVPSGKVVPAFCWAKLACERLTKQANKIMSFFMCYYNVFLENCVVAQGLKSLLTDSVVPMGL
jgi:hypothetical protein